MDWLLLQLADSAFPTGGFAHSGGLEAAWQQREVRDANTLRDFIGESLHQAGWASFPLINAAHAAPESLPEFDALCHAFLSNHVANRASRMQGRALLATCERCFPAPEVAALKVRAREAKLKLHLAPVFGAMLRAMNFNREQTQQLFLFITLRGIVSAAVRLNIIGPHEAQQIQLSAYPVCDEVLSACGDLRIDDLAQTAPLIDMFQSTHDRLYSRLFQS